MNTVTGVVKLSHKQFRAMLKKFRRKRKRQLLAKEREEQELLEQQHIENSPNYKEWEEERCRNSRLFDEFEERERARNHKMWLLREEQAQIEFIKKQEQLNQEKIKHEEERKRILAEFEQQQYLESKKEEENQKIKSQKEVIKIEIFKFSNQCFESVLVDFHQDEALQEVLSNLPQDDGPWHNPMAPDNYSTGKEREQCQFFAKTGCCRFGERCSRGHIHPSVSTTILIRGMYNHFSFGHTERDDFDTDSALEYEDKERYQDFKNFYYDVLPEFKKIGKVIQFKVCCNHEPHLRGNVYVQFSREAEAVEAYQKFNGRYYAGRQLTCDFTNVIKWRSAICGLFFRKLCPKGLNCNFLHVFKNPTDEFWEADRDIPLRENSYVSHSSRSNYSRNKSERRSSHREYYSESRRHHRVTTPENKSDYYYSSSYHHDRSSDSAGEYEENGHRGSSRNKYSERRKDSPHRSHRKRKHRDSRSRSPTPISDDTSGSVHSHKRSKHKKKKKSKKSRRGKNSDESES